MGAITLPTNLAVTGLTGFHIHCSSHVTNTHFINFVVGEVKNSCVMWFGEEQLKKVQKHRSVHSTLRSKYTCTKRTNGMYLVCSVLTLLNLLP